MSEIQLKATSVEDKPVRIGDLPIIKTNILENARQMDKGVVGGYNGAFPLTAASEGGIYLLPSTGKFYVCETAYNGSQLSAPNSNFVELSVWKNHDRLNNLISINGINSNLEIKVSRVTGSNDRTILFNKPFKNKCIAVFLTDISSGALYRQGIKTDTITKEGFIMRSESLEETDQTQYLAIGY